MSKPATKPHRAKVYHYEGEGEQMRLALREQQEFPSKGQAERFASHMRRFPFISSVVVEPIETYQGIPVVADETLCGTAEGASA